MAERGDHATSDARPVRARSGHPLRIEALSYRTLAGARSLLNRVFPEQYWWERSDVALPVSLYKDDPDRPVARLLARVVLAVAGVRDVRYWVALDGDDVVAISGYYLLRKDGDEAVWAGWTCVDPARRRGLSGVGGRLLRHVAERIRVLDRRYYRLYTTATNRRMLNVLARGGYREIRAERPWWSSDEVRYLEVPVADVVKRLGLDGPAAERQISSCIPSSTT
jgi:hypothetical protein